MTAKYGTQKRSKCCKHQLTEHFLIELDKLSNYAVIILFLLQPSGNQTSVLIQQQLGKRIETVMTVIIKTSAKKILKYGFQLTVIAIINMK